jgi:ketosteroid isomerase-like protein
MKIVLSAVVAAFLALFPAAEFAFAQDGPPAPDDKGQIESRIATIQHGVATRNIEEVISGLDDSAVVIADARTVRGRNNARQVLSFMLTRMVAVSFDMTTAILRVADTSAFHTGDFRYTLEFPMGGSFTRAGTFVADWRKRGDHDWRIVQIVAAQEQEPDE